MEINNWKMNHQTMVPMSESTLSSSSSPCPNTMTSPPSTISSPFCNIISPLGKCTSGRLHSPLATPPAQKSRRSRKFLKLECALEAERFDRNYLEDEVKRQSQKIEEMSKLETLHLNEIIQLKGKISELANSSEHSEGESTAKRMNKENERRLCADVQSLERDLLQYMEDIAKSREEKEVVMKKLAESENSLSIWRSQALDSDSAQDLLKNQLEGFKTQVTNLKSALVESNKILEEYRRDNQMNVSIECDDDTLTLRKAMNTSFNSPLENLGKAVIDVQLKEQINLNLGMTQEIENLKKENQDISVDLKSTLLRVEELERTTAELSLEREELMIKVESLPSIKEQLKESHSVLSNVSGQLTLAREQEKHLETAAEELKLTIEKLNGDLVAQITTTQKLLDDKNLLKDKIDASSAAISQTHLQISSLEETLRILETERRQLESDKNKEINSLKNKQSDMQKIVDSCLTKLKTTKVELKTVTDSVKVLKEEKKKVETDLEEYKMDLKMMVGDAVNLKKELEDYKEESIKYAEMLNSKDVTIEKLLQSTSMMENVISSLNVKLEESETQKQIQIDDFIQKEEALSLNSQLLEREMETVQSQLSDLCERQLECVNVIEELKQECSDKNELIAALEGEQSDFKKVIDSMSVELKCTKADLHVSDDLINNLKKERETLGNDLEESKIHLEQFEVSKTLVRSLNEKLEKISVQCNSSAQNEEASRLYSQDLELQIKNLNDEKQKNESTIENLISECSGKNELVLELENKRSDLQQIVDFSLSELATAKCKIIDDSKLIETLKEENSKCQTDSEELKLQSEKLESLQTEVGSLNKKLEKVTVQCNDLEKNEEATKLYSQGLKQQITNLNEEKQINESTIENFISDCSNKNEMVLVLENKCSDLQRIVDGNLSEMELAKCKLINANKSIQTLNEENFRFQTELKECKILLENLDVSQTREEATRQYSQVLELQIKNLNEEKQKNESIIENLSAECSSKNEQVVVLKSINSDLQQIADSNISELETSRSELINVNKIISQLKEEKSKYESDLEKCKIVFEKIEVAQNPSCCLSEKIENLDVQRRERLTELMQIISDKEEMINSNSQSLNCEIQTVRGQLDDLNEVKNKQVSILETEISHLKTKVESSSSEANSTARELSTAKITIGKLKEDRDRFQALLEKWKMKFTKLSTMQNSISENLDTSQIQKLDWADDVTSNCQKFEVEIEAICNKIIKLNKVKQKNKTAIEELKAKCSEKSKAVDALETKNSDLQQIVNSNLSELQTTKSELISANGSVKNFKKEKDTFELILNEYKINHDKLEVMNCHLGENLQRLEAKSQIKISEFIQKEEANRYNSQALEQEIETHRNHLNEIKNINEIVIGDLKSESYNKNEQIRVLENKISELQQIIDSNYSELKITAKELNAANAKIKILTEEKSRFEADLEKLKIDLKECEDICQNKSEEIDSLLCKNINFVEQLSNFEAKINQHIKDSDVDTNIIKELSKTREDLNFLTKTLKNELKLSDSSLNDKCCLIEELTETINKNMEIISSHKIEIKQLSEKNIKLEERNVNVQRNISVEIDQSVSKNVDQDKIIADLNNKLKTFTQTASLKDVKMNDMTLIIDEHHETIEIYEAQLTDLRDEIAAKNLDIETQSKEIDNMRSEIEIQKSTVQQYEESVTKNNILLETFIQEKIELEIVMDSMKLESVEDKQSNCDNLSCNDSHSFHEDIGDVDLQMKFTDSTYHPGKLHNELASVNCESSFIEDNKIKSKLLELCRSTEMISKTCARNILEKDEIILNLTGQCDNLKEKIMELEYSNTLLARKIDALVEKTDSQNDTWGNNLSSNNDSSIFKEKLQFTNIGLEDSNSNDEIDEAKVIYQNCKLKVNDIPVKMSVKEKILKNLDNSDTISSTTHKLDVSGKTFGKETVEHLQRLVNRTCEGELKLKNALNVQKDNDLRLNKLRKMLSVLNDKIFNCMGDKNVLEEALTKKQQLETEICNVEHSNLETSSIIIEYTVKLFKWTADNIQCVIAKDTGDVSQDSFNNSDIHSFIIQNILDERLSENLNGDMLDIQKFTEKLCESDSNMQHSILNSDSRGISVYMQLYETAEKYKAVSEKLVINEERLLSIDTDVENLKTENTKLRAAHEDVQDKLAGLRIVLKQAKSNNNQLTSANEELKTSMEIEMNLHAKEREHYQKVMGDNMDLKRQIEILISKINDLNERLYAEAEAAKSSYDRLLSEHQKLSAKTKSSSGEETNQIVTEMRNEYEDKLTRMKQKMKQLYQEQIALYSEKQKEETASLEALCNKYTAKIKSYEAHVNQLSSEIWKIGEKLLMEKNEKDWLRKQLKEKCSSQLSLNSISSASSFPQSKLNSQLRHSQQSLPRERQDIAAKRLPTSHSSTFKVPISSKVESGGLHMSDEEGEVFDNTYLLDLKSGICEPRANSTANVNVSGFQPDRLSELQWRNSLCLPHMKSSYPAETQFIDRIKEEEIKMGAFEIDENITSEKLRPKKEAGQTSYKRPGPPTPSKNGGRSSLQGNEGREPLRENTDSNMPKKATTPSRIKSLFMGNSSRSTSRDENTFGTPKGRRLSIFRKQR